MFLLCPTHGSCIDVYDEGSVVITSFYTSVCRGFRLFCIYLILRCFCNQQHLNIIASLTYDYRKLLSHRKIILRFFCNQPHCISGHHLHYKHNQIHINYSLFLCHFEDKQVRLTYTTTEKNKFCNNMQRCEKLKL